MVVAVGTVASTIAMGPTVGIAGLNFVQTPAGLIQEAPLTCGELNTLARARMPDGYTLMDNPSGVIAMHRATGHGYVLARGPQNNPAKRFMDPVPLAGETLAMGLSRDPRATLTGGVVVDLMPNNGVYDERLKANFPVVGLSWYQGAAIAAGFTDLQGGYLIRMMTSEEYDRVVLSDGTEREEDLAQKLYSAREQTGDIGPVVGEAAEGRRSRWGVIDVFGNVKVLTNDVYNPKDLTDGKPISEIDRVSRGASWIEDGFTVRNVTGRGHYPPWYSNGLNDTGVRFVAVPRVFREGVSAPMPREALHRLLSGGIETLNLSTRAFTILCFVPRIRYIGDLVLQTDGELLRISNFGPKSLKDVKNALAAIGLHLGMDTQGWQRPQN